MLSRLERFLRLLNDLRGGQHGLQSMHRRNGRHANSPQKPCQCGYVVEALEDRSLLAAAGLATPTFMIKGLAPPPGTAPAAATGAAQATVAPIDPAQMQAAYGVNLISFGGVKGTGQGQTIAIVDPDNDPNIIADANSFSSNFGLQQFNGSGGPTLQVLNQNGGTSLAGVPNAVAGGWDVLESLDVEWAHAIAPQASIILFEANSNSLSDLLTAVRTAAGTAGVSTVSYSWTSSEFSGEQSDDSSFVTPAGHQGVTFLASTGDGPFGAGYPAYSPNVVAVGATSLDINTSGTYLAETAWPSSGGGISAYEAQPSYQSGKVNGTSSTRRTAPDISMDSDPNTGVYVLDSYYSANYLDVGNTTATPMMAGVIAIADQGRVLKGLTTLDGPSQTLPMLYNLPSANLHDITTTTEGLGHVAGPGYDLATGLGSPIVNDFVTALSGYQTNQPPAVTAPVSLATLDANTSFTFSGGSIGFTDAAASGASDSLSVSVIHGTLTLGSTAGLTFTSGANGTSLMTVTGTLANLNAALSGLVYTPTSNYYFDDYLEISVNDASDSQTGSANVPFTFYSPPWISVRPQSDVPENNVLRFFNWTAITDGAASGTSDMLTLSVADGKLTLGSTTGLTFISGSNNSSSMTVNGTLANLNAALTNLDYTPNTNYLGPDAVQLSVIDSNDSLTASATAPISVVVPPALSAPVSANAIENSSYRFLNAVSLTDVNASGSSDSVFLSVNHGEIWLLSTTGLTFTIGSSTNTLMEFTGTLANLNAALSDFLYLPSQNYSGVDYLNILLTNNVEEVGAPSAEVFLSVSAGTVPVVLAPNTATLNEYTSFNFSNSIRVIDDYANVTSDSLSLSVSNGKLTLGSTTGLTFPAGSNGSSSMTINGTLASLNAAVNGLTYVPNLNYSGLDTLQMSVKNSLDNLSSSTPVGLTVITTPTIFTPASATAYENRSFTFSNSAISITDPSASGTSDSLSLSVSSGRLTLSVTTGLTFNAGSNNSSSMTVTGTLANLNAALNGLVYAPNSGYIGPDLLSISVKNSIENLTGAVTVPIAVDGPPSIAAPATQTVGEGRLFIFNSSIILTDAAASSTSDVVSLSVSHGVIYYGSSFGITIISGANNSPSLTISGSVAALNASLNLEYTPTAGYLGPDSLQISVTDSLDNFSASAAVSFSVIAPPAVSAPQQIKVSEYSAYNFSSGAITLTDPYASGTSDSLTLSGHFAAITLGSTNGLTFITGANGSNGMTVSGTLADLNAAVSGLVYTPNPQLSQLILALSLDDSGNNLGSTSDVFVTIIAPQPPSITAPSTASLNENSSLTFSGGSIAVTDAAAAYTGNLWDSVTLSVADGVLTLGSTTGLTFNSGSNNSSSMTVTGTWANVNKALNGLIYAPTSGFSGHDSLQLVVNDSGDGLTASAAVAIAVNAPPIVTTLAALDVNENSSYAFFQRRAESDGCLRLGDVRLGHTFGQPRHADAGIDHRADLYLGRERLLIDDRVRNARQPEYGCGRPRLYADYQLQRPRLDTDSHPKRRG